METPKERTDTPVMLGRLQAQAARAVGFLQLIDGTIDGLQADSDALRAYTDNLRNLCVSLSESKRKSPIDQDGRISDLLQQASASARRIHGKAVASMQAAKIGPALHVEDGVAEAWSQFIDALADHHNALEDLRDTVETLDALLSPKTGPEYTDVDEMIGNLLAS